MPYSASPAPLEGEQEGGEPCYRLGYGSGFAQMAGGAARATTTARPVPIRVIDWSFLWRRLYVERLWLTRARNRAGEG